MKRASIPFLLVTIVIALAILFSAGEEWAGRAPTAPGGYANKGNSKKQAPS